MKKFEVLKAVVIVQAVCMIALTGVVFVKLWPTSAIKEGEQQLQQPSSSPSSAVSPTPPPEHSGEAVATIGKESITREQLTAELYELYGDEVLRMLLVRKAIDLEAEAYQLYITQEELDRELAYTMEGYDSEQQFFTVMLEQLGMTKQQVLDEVRYRLLLEEITARSIEITDAEVNDYITQHPELFEPQLQLHLRWIVAESQTTAIHLLESLAEGYDFVQLAQTYSIDPFTAEIGGDLGLIDADDPFYSEDILNAAKKLDIGGITGPISIEEGSVIIQLLGRKETAVDKGQSLLDTVRKQLALERAKSLSEVEAELLDKYKATITI